MCDIWHQISSPYPLPLEDVVAVLEVAPLDAFRCRLDNSDAFQSLALQPEKNIALPNLPCITIVCVHLRLRLFPL